MNKIIKKITSSLTAVAMSASMLATAGLADEPVYYYNWKVSYTAVGTGAGYTGTKDYLYMVYSTKGLRFYCNGVSNTRNGATGKATAECTNSNITMSSVTMTGQGQIFTRTLVLNGAVKGVNLEIRANTEETGNTFSAKGAVHTII